MHMHTHTYTHMHTHIYMCINVTLATVYTRSAYSSVYPSWAVFLMPVAPFTTVSPSFSAYLSAPVHMAVVKSAPSEVPCTKPSTRSSRCPARTAVSRRRSKAVWWYCEAGMARPKERLLALPSISCVYTDVVAAAGASISRLS